MLEKGRTLEKITPNKTKLTLDYYQEKNFPAQLLFTLFKKKKLEDSFRRSLTNLDAVAKEIVLPT